MKSRIVCKFVKKILYKTLIHTVLMYGCETWKLSKKKTEDLLNSFKRKNLRWIFGPVRKNGMWGSEELHREYKDVDRVPCIQFKWRQWAGHVQKLPLDCIPKKALEAAFANNWPVGKPRFKWEQGVKMLPDFYIVATGSKPQRTEQCGGRNYVKPWFNYGLECHRMEVNVNGAYLKD